MSSAVRGLRTVLRLPGRDWARAALVAMGTLLGGVAPVPADDATAAAQRWSVLPVLGYTTGTTLFLGGMAVRYLPEVTGTRGSSIPTVAIASLKGQYQAFLVPDVYSAGNRWHLLGSATVARWPANAYPRGNDSRDDPLEYQLDGIDVELRLERCLSRGVYAGPTVRVAWEDVAWKAARPLLPGSGGGRRVGFGAVALYDTRDNVNEAHAGMFVTASAAAYRAALGSGEGFVTCTVQARRYVRLADRRSVALACDLELLGGRPPFTQWSTPDGVRVLRGIENGRYRDSHLLSLQAEYRQRLGGPWGATAFADAAQVAPRLRAFSPGNLRAALGGGLRYALNPRQRYNLRLDAAWVEGGMGFVCNAGEAF